MPTVAAGEVKRLISFDSGLRPFDPSQDGDVDARGRAENPVKYAKYLGKINHVKLPDLADKTEHDQPLNRICEQEEYEDNQAA